MTGRTRNGRQRDGGRWFVDSGYDLLVLVSSKPDGLPIDVAPNVAAELLAILAERGVTVTASGGRLYTFGRRPTRCEQRAVRAVERQLIHQDELRRAAEGPGR